MIITDDAFVGLKGHVWQRTRGGKPGQRLQIVRSTWLSPGNISQQDDRQCMQARGKAGWILRSRLHEFLHLNGFLFHLPDSCAEEILLKFDKALG